MCVNYRVGGQPRRQLIVRPALLGAPLALPVGAAMFIWPTVTPLRVSRAAAQSRVSSTLRFEFAGHFTGDDARATLVLRIELIVFAKQAPEYVVARNRHRAEVADKMHRAVDDAVFDRNGRCAIDVGGATWRKHVSRSGIAYPDSPANDVTVAPNLFCADY